jgi:hypothetical protein
VIFLVFLVPCNHLLDFTVIVFALEMISENRKFILFYQGPSSQPAIETGSATAWPWPPPPGLPRARPYKKGAAPCVCPTPCPPPPPPLCRRRRAATALRRTEPTAGGWPPIPAGPVVIRPRWAHHPVPNDPLFWFRASIELLGARIAGATTPQGRRPSLCASVQRRKKTKAGLQIAPCLFL